MSPARLTPIVAAFVLAACGDDGASSSGEGGGASGTSVTGPDTASATSAGGAAQGTATSSASGATTSASSSAGGEGGAGVGGAHVGAGGAGGADVGSGGGGGDAPVVDPCAAVPAPSCSTDYPTSAGQGLVALDRCAFPMDVTDDWAAHDARITALEALLPHASIADVLGDLNRTGAEVASVPGLGGAVEYAFRWNAEDESSTRWFPQGLSGSPDASADGLVEGRRVIVASFYDSIADDAANKGARIAFADVTGPGAPTYRYALLVETTGSPAAPNLAPVPTHAGGIAWVGHYLYVAQTGSGFRVFDLDRMMQVATDVDAIGCDAAGCTAGLYKYVIPQVGAYRDVSACNPLFSFVALDATSTPPALLSGEYCSGSACAAPLAGRLLRWPLDPATGLLAAPRTWPTDAFFMGETQVQGGVTIDGTAFLSSSAPAAGGGELYRATVQSSDALPWSDAPEDLMFDSTAGSAGWLWGLSEAVGARYVFAREAAAVLP